MNEMPKLPLRNETPKAIWESPESALFYEWYEQQNALSKEKQSEAFQSFLDLVAIGKAELPRYLAHQRVKRIREQG